MENTPGPAVPTAHWETHSDRHVAGRTKGGRSHVRRGMIDGVESARESLLRRLPSVDHLLQQATIAPLCDEYPREQVKRATQEVLAERRAALMTDQSIDVDPPRLALAIRERLQQRRQPSLRRVINATGIVLHTGLGRAPLAQEAVDAIMQVALGYCNLEFDLAGGDRGDRHSHVRDLLCELTGAADALVVNNNAAATWLALNSLAKGREVVISRGELVEIGGSYRMPDVMTAAGCRMVEVGTTNRTHLHDYERALSADTAAIVRVHTSNYRVQGFTARPALGDLVARVRQANAAAGGGASGSAGTRLPIRLIDDLGSGLLDRGIARSVSAAGGPEWDEPAVRDSVAAGADLVLFSGDKLLGGPQAGIIVGGVEPLGQLRRNPLMRTVRPGKLCLAALEATLRLYRDPQRLIQSIPALRMLAAPVEQLDPVAIALAGQCREALPDAIVELQSEKSFAGGGALPTLEFPTRVVAIRSPRHSAAELAQSLRRRDVPVIGRVQHEAVCLDCRTIHVDEVAEIGAALADVGST